MNNLEDLDYLDDLHNLDHLDNLELDVHDHEIGKCLPEKGRLER